MAKGQARLSNEQIDWLRRQAARAREIEGEYLACQKRFPNLWTVQGQQMLESVSDNRAYFEHELEEAVCLQSVS